MKELETLDYEGLSVSNQLAVDNMRMFVSQMKQRSEYLGIMDPLAGGQIHVSVPMTLELFEIANVDQANDYLTLVEQVAVLFEQVMQIESEIVEQELFMTEKQFREVAAAIIAVPAQGSNYFLIESFNNKIDALSDITEAEREELKERNLTLITGAFFDAYKNLSAEFGKLSGKWRRGLPACQQPNTLFYDHYLYRLNESSGRELTPYTALKMLRKWMDKGLEESGPMSLSLYIAPNAENQKKVEVVMEGTDEALKYLEELSYNVLGELPEHSLSHTIPDESISKGFSAA